jgi:predicted transcriptional regulator
MAWVLEGKSSSDIAMILQLSPHSVDEYIKEACRRFGVRSRIQAALAFQNDVRLRADKSSAEGLAQHRPVASEGLSTPQGDGDDANEEHR